MQDNKIYLYNDPLKYSFSANLIEVLLGTRLKDLRPANSTFFADYNSVIDGNWASGVKTGTASGGASILNEELDLSYGDKRYVDYDGNLNADLIQTGCIRIQTRPNYITPVGEHVIFTICEQNNSMKNLIFYRDTGNHHRLHIYDNAANLIIEANFGYQQSVVGQLYDIEFNFDVTAGEIRMFIDGVQFGTTKNATGIRDNNINLFRVGCDYQDSTNSNFKVNNFLLYDTVQHIADYTPNWTSIPATIWSKENPSIETIESFKHDELINMIETIVKTGNDTAKHTISKDGVHFYHNGSIWVIADGSYSQTNTVAEIVANKSTFTTVDTYSKLKSFLHSEDGFSTPELQQSEVVFDKTGEDPEIVGKCEVWVDGIITNDEIYPDKIFISMFKNSVKYKNRTTVVKKYHEISADVNGRFKRNLVENTNMEGINNFYRVTIGTDIFDIFVPENTDISNIYDLRI